MADLVIATEFSLYPAGRTDEDGPHNGMRFRKEFLVPRLGSASSDDKLRVVLDGCRSFGSSFLEEAFGGLVTDEGFTVERLARVMEIVAVKPVYFPYKRMIGKYLTEAATRARLQRSA